MKRQLLVNWLLIVAALGSLIAVISTRDRVTSGELMQREQNLLQVFEESAVSRIAVEGGAAPFAMVRDPAAGPDEFKLIEPVEERAKVEKVSSLLGSLRFASFLRRVEEPESAALGLEHPRWVLHVDQLDVHYRIRMGARAASPPGSSYLEVTGENVAAKGVFVVRDGLVSELTLKLDDFRSHELAAIGQNSLAQVRLQDAQSQWTLKNDAGRWRFSGSHEEGLADRNQVERFFTQLARLKLEKFLDPATARGILGKDVLRLSLVPKQAGHASVEIEIGAPCPDHPMWLTAIRSEGATNAGCVSREITEELRIRPETLLERHLFSLRHDEVESFELIRADAKLALTRSASGFHMTAPTEGDVEPDVAEQLLKDWLEFTGDLQNDASTVTLGEPRASVVIHAVSDVAASYREQRLELGSVEGKPGLFALRKADGAVLQLPQFDLDQLDVTDLTLRSHVVLDLQARQLVRIEVTTQDIHQVIIQTELGPVLTEPQSSGADGVLLMDLIDKLRGLRAVRWVAASDRGEFGLSGPWSRVAFTVEVSADKREEHLLRLGDSTRGGFFAQLDQGPVFVLNRSSAETFSTWMLDRAVFSPPLDPVARIELSSERGRISLERNGSRFEQVGAQLHVSSTDLEALLNELDALHPEVALHRGPALPSEGFGRPLLRYVAQRKNGDVRVAWMIGAADTFRDIPVYFARVDGIAATYVIARGPIQRILDVL